MAEAAFSERHVSAQDGLSLYLRDYGDALATATPVLCLSGLTRNGKDFHEFASRLAGGRRVVCPDYRGRGRSEHDRDWRNYGPRTYLTDLVHILAALDLHRVVVVGTSLGGLLAMGLGAALPTALAAVVLNDIGPEIPDTGLGPIIEYIRVDRPVPDMDHAAEVMRTLLPTISLRDPEIWHKVARNTYRLGDDGLLHFDWDPAIVRPLLEGPPPPPLWPLFRSLRNIPVLAIRGAVSPLLTESCFDRMAEIKRDLVRVTVPETGHAPTLLEAELGEVLFEFIDAH